MNASIFKNKETPEQEKIAQKIQTDLAQLGFVDPSGIELHCPIGKMDAELWLYMDLEKVKLYYDSPERKKKTIRENQWIEKMTIIQELAKPDVFEIVVKYKENENKVTVNLESDRIDEYESIYDSKWFNELIEKMENYGFKKQAKKIKLKRLFSYEQAITEAEEFTIDLVEDAFEEITYLEKKIFKQIHHIRKTAFEQN